MRKIYKGGPYKTRSLIILLPLLLTIIAHDQAWAGSTYQLCSLLGSGGTVTLNSANTYTISDQCNILKSVTISGNGVTINGVGPIVASGSGITLTVNNLVFKSSSWAALAAVNGGHLVVQSSTIYCPSGTGLYANAGSTITAQNTDIPSATYGVQITNTSSADLHGLTVTGVPYAVMVSGIGASVTIDGNSLLDYSGAGAGVAIMDGASGVVYDSTINGFTNGIDIHPTGATIYNGTVDVQNCTFDHNSAALAASYGTNIRFSYSTVTNAVNDGLYFSNSTAVVDESRIIGSMNSGVSFIGCPSGTIQNSLVENSAHQGVSVVAQDSSSPPSQSINVLNNTFINNQIANLLVDDRSTAQIRGNIFTQTPDANIRFHGPKGITLDSALVIDSMSGMEICQSSTPNIVLSVIGQNDKNGILVYDNSSLTAEQSVFWNNGFANAGGSASIYVNDGAQANMHSCTFGPAGTEGFYNYSIAACDVSLNYWDAADGPDVDSWVRPSGVGNGSGAHLTAGYQTAGPVTYIPYLTQSPVSSNVNDAVGLASGGGLAWDSTLGLTIGLTANQGSVPLSNEILGVLKVNDTENMTLVTPPDYLLQGQLYVVWISVSLRFNSASGFLQFSLPSQNRPVDLKRRGAGGSWTQVASVWDQSSHTLTYSPTDPHQLNGTFAITETPDAVYVKCDGLCSGNAPCYISVQDGAGSIVTDTVMYATNETFSGNVTYDVPAALNLSGGWDATYSTDHAYTHIQGSLTITGGELIAGNVVVE
jgi:Right handed beta helix region